MKMIYCLFASFCFASCNAVKSNLNSDPDWKQDFSKIAENTQKGIPLYLMESDYAYGAYDGQPRRIGILTADDMRALAAAKQIDHVGETQDFWYALRWDLPPHSPTIGISISPVEEYGIQLTWPQYDTIHLDEKHIHQKLLKMIPKK